MYKVEVKTTGMLKQVVSRLASGNIKIKVFIDAPCFSPSKSIDPGKTILIAADGQGITALDAMKGMKPSDMSKLDTSAMIDATEWFWDRIPFHGICLFDRKHVKMLRPSRFIAGSVEAGHKRCALCGWDQTMEFTYAS